MLHTIGIVGHVQRARQAHTLAHTVNAAHLSIDDSAPNFHSANQNHLRTWRTLAQHGAEWSVVLEDDAQPINNFSAQLEQALLNAPTPVVSLYLGRKFPQWWQQHIATAIERVQTINASYIVTDYLLHCVGVAVKTDFIPCIVDRPTHLPIDEHISEAARRYLNKPSVAYTWPSLVDHEDGPPVISAHNDGTPRTPGRKAWHAGPRQHWDSTTAPMWPHG
jgi:hypothetical protein